MTGNFAEWLTRHLQEKRLKKKVFAEMVHTTPQTVSRWCNGVIIPEENTILAIKYVLGIYSVEQKQKLIESYTTDELLAEIKRRIEAS